MGKFISEEGIVYYESDEPCPGCTCGEACDVFPEFGGFHWFPFGNWCEFCGFEVPE